MSIMLIFSSSELVEPHIIPLKVRLGVDHLIFDGGGVCKSQKKYRAYVSG